MLGYCKKVNLHLVVDALRRLGLMYTSAIIQLKAVVHLKKQTLFLLIAVV